MYGITKGVIVIICVGGGYMQRKIMVRVSGVRVRRGSRNGSQENGQTMNEFVQVTLFFSYLEFEDGVFPTDTDNFYSMILCVFQQRTSELTSMRQYPCRDVDPTQGLFQMQTNESSVQGSQGCWCSMLIKMTVQQSNLLLCF